VALNARMRGYRPLDDRSCEGEARAGTSRQEAFWVGRDRPVSADNFRDGLNQWPAAQPGLKPAMRAYFAAAERLGFALMRGFSLALGQDEGFLGRLFDCLNSRLKLNHYPPQDDPERVNDIGVVPHSDAGGFTILWQDDNGGLEVQSGSGERAALRRLPEGGMAPHLPDRGHSRLSGRAR
jgi:isopenicillin N synthase-like dioxygenase